MLIKLCSLQTNLCNVVVLHGKCNHAKLEGRARFSRGKVQLAAWATPRRAMALAAAVHDQASNKPNPSSQYVFLACICTDLKIPSLSMLKFLAGLAPLAACATLPKLASWEVVSLAKCLQWKL